MSGFRPMKQALGTRFRIGLLVTGVAAVLGTQLAWATTAVAAPVLQPCSASYIGVPGSGQTSTSSAEMTTVGNWLDSYAANAGQKLRNSTNLSYPAVPWYEYVKPSQYVTPTLAMDWNNLGKSEATGEANLTAKINSDRAAASAAGCPDAPILLAGYSQGAEVVVRTVDALAQSVRNTISVALLGNPSFTPGVAGDLNLNSNPDLEGIRPSFLLSQRYTLKSDVIKRTIDICAASDPICAYHASEVPGLVDGQSAHYHYISLTYGGIPLAQYAAIILWGHRASASPVTSPAPLPGAGRILISPCLNLRAGPNGSTSLVGCIPVNTTINIDCTASGNAVTGPYGTETLWDHTTYNGTAGYVADAWVYTGTNGPVAPSCSAPKPAGRILISPCLNLRKGPNGSTALIGCIPHNTVVDIQCTAQGNAVTGPYGTETIWDRTTYNGTIGYIADAWVYTGTNSAVAPAC
jgi:uncharacterized protein YraI